jgi:predicted metal-dependent peptidase
VTSLDQAKIAAARLWASVQQPYLSSALFACSVQEAPSSGGVAVDRGWRIQADPDVVTELAVPELGRLLLHLVAHLVRGHGDRADAVAVSDEDRNRWNQCADAEINDDLNTAGLLPPLAATLPADLGHPDGGLVEAYFAAGRGPEGTATSFGSGVGGRVKGTAMSCGSGAGGVPLPGDNGPVGLPPGQSEMLRLALARDIADRHRREPGSVPAGWVRWAEALVPSTVDWRRVLGAEIRRAVAAVAGAVDYSYRRPSRRSHGNSLPRPIMPMLYRPIPSVAVVCDTSGSMGEAELAQVLAEVDGLLRRAGLASTRMPVLAVDTEVHATRRVGSVGQVRLAGGGGTDMGAGIAAAASLRPRPDVIVVLTDGWTPWPAAAPRGCRVIVGVIGDGSGPPAPPWARTVAINLD